MSKRTLCVLLILLLIGMPVLLNTKPVNAFETIYIRADGSVDPSTAPIQQNGNVYTFTNNITIEYLQDGIIAERDNIVIDGAGYTIQANEIGYCKGIHLSGRSNITIKNVEVKSFGCGIYLQNSQNILLYRNILTNIGWNIQLDGSSNNVIKENNATDCDNYSIYLSGSNNTISKNNLARNLFPIVLDDASNNIIAGNMASGRNITGFSGAGIAIHYHSNFNTIYENTMMNNTYGLSIHLSSYNAIFQNNVTKNEYGVRYSMASNNTIYHNTFNNTIQILDFLSFTDYWDDGYPSGGNYWSDYNGTDLYSGPYQNETGSDGIGDTPHIVNADNRDNYPLMNPWTQNTVYLEQRIVALVNGTRAYNYDLELEGIGESHYAYRSGGSTGATETANWIKDQFQSFGLEAWLEPFEFTTWDLLNKPSFTIDDDGDAGTTFDQITINSFQCEHYSWPTFLNGAFADLVVLPLPEAANRGEIGMNPINMTAWNAIDTTGKILLIGREIRWSFSWASAYINKLTAQTPLAVVHTWWYDWMFFTPAMIPSTGGRPLSTLGPFYWNLEIAIGSVNYEDGLWIRNRESALDVSANVSINSVIGSGTNYNVVGKIEGYEEPEKTVIVSAHYDTVMTNGFGDNGAGTAGVIELAKVFADATETGFYKPKYSLLFVAFTDEELCFIGAINYVRQHKSEMASIVAFINLDCIGSDDFFVTETDPANGLDLDEVVLQAAEDLGIPAGLESPGGSDQEAFRSPSDVNYYCNAYWGVDPEIGDATPVASSALLISMPVAYSDMWSMGVPGWIHTPYDNSTSTSTLNWIEVEDLEDHIKIAALTMVRISPHVVLENHDVAVINVTPYKTIVGQTYSIWINITLENQGDYAETFGVTIYADATAINAFAGIILPSAHTTTITLLWNTTSFAKGNYTINAIAEMLLGEIDTDDNTAADGNVFVGIPGDIAAAYRLVDMKDIGTVVKAFGSVHGHFKWNPNADINNDNKVDMKDIGITVQHFGQTDP